MTDTPPSSDTAPSSNDPLLGAVVGGRWRISSVVGRGGMGVVYAAQNTAIGKRVALKFIEGDIDRETALRFQREAEAASAVESAHIVQVFDAGVEQGRPFLVMELLQGESLGARIRRDGRLPVNDALHVVGQALRGLARAHAAGVIHRDLKPDNLFLVDRDDDSTFLKILDFGISKMRAGAGVSQLTTLTHRGMVLGTPHYMAPEQAQGQGEIDERADLFSMGAILYECLTGRPPHAGLPTYEAVIVAICTRDAPDVRKDEPTVPAPIAAVVRRALSRDREDRYATAYAFLEALRDAAPNVSSLARVSSADPSTPRPAMLVRSPSNPTEPSARTDTNWTERGKAQHISVPPTLPAGTDPALRGAVTATPTRRYLIALAVVIATAACAITVAIVRSGPSMPVRPDAPASSGLEVTLHVETTPSNAALSVDGRPLHEHVIHGKFGSRVVVKASAPGYQDREESVALDGKPFLAFPLADATDPPVDPETRSSMGSASAATSVDPAGSAAGKPGKPLTSASARPGSTALIPSTSAPGTGGLQLKVTP